MRVLADIPHPEFKIQIFSLNGKFIVKIEAGIYEQAFRINEEIVGGDIEKLKSIITDDFIKNCRPRFLSMREDLGKALENLKINN